jgi:hypothetical protein
LFALGVLSLARPDLLVTESELGKLFLGSVFLFWLARLALQPLVFDSVMRTGWTRSIAVRVLAVFAFATYAIVYGVSFAHQCRWDLWK